MMKSVCTMALSLVVAGAATTSMLFAQSGRVASTGLFALPETGMVYRTARFQPELPPAENVPADPDDSVIKAPPPPTSIDEANGYHNNGYHTNGHSNGASAASNGCATSCEQGCTASCDTGCAAACDKGCAPACEEACAPACEEACAPACEEACAPACDSGCASSCDSGCASTCDSGCAGACGEYSEAMNSPWCEDCVHVPTCCPHWSAYAGALIMTRDQPNRFWTTFDAEDAPDQIGNSRDADVDWTGGVEVSVARTCGCNTLEAVYWGLYGFEGEATIIDNDGAGLVSTPIDLGGVFIGADPATDFFDAAAEHRLRRDNDVHNVELNWIHNLRRGRLNVGLLTGFRYLRFDEGFSLIGVAGGADYSDADQRAHLDVDVENDLYGVQIGARTDYQAGSALNLFLASKVGLFGNDVESRAHLYRGDFGAEGFDIQASQDDVAILAQLEAGIDYQLNCNWTFTVGYRAVAISGIALSDEQIPPFLIDAPAFEDIDTNGSLILHGAFLGAEYRF